MRRKDCHAGRQSVVGGSDRILRKSSLFRQSLVTSHESRLLRHAISLLHYFVASSSRPASSSREESCRRNSPRWSAPYPPKCPVLPGLRPLPLPASTPELARTPANGPSLASSDRDRIHGPRRSSACQRDSAVA